MMFHVAPWLTSEMHRRLIGNDICVLVYYDEPNPALSLNPLVFDGLGTVPQVFAVVQPFKNKYRSDNFLSRNVSSPDLARFDST